MRLFRQWMCSLGKGRFIYVVGLLSLTMAGSVAADQVMTDEPILPLPLQHGQDEQKAALGRKLFHDKRLSRDDSISCASCHDLARGGVDGAKFSVGVNGAKGNINAPTVYHSGFSLVQFWDGRAPTLDAQVDGPVHNPVEMAANWGEVISKLKQDPFYPGQFHAVYKAGISAEAIRDAIAAFERTLVTVNSPFDRWLRGDEKALSIQEKEGYQLFKSYGCIACHQGANVGGNMYQQMGAMGDYFTDRGGKITKADLGRFNVTGLEEDRHHFKVPSLRLAALTAPYFHDASAVDLKQAIQDMAKYQLGRSITDYHAAKIEAFIKTLVGEHPELSP